MKPIKVKLMYPMVGFDAEAIYDIPKDGDIVVSSTGDLFTVKPVHSKVQPRLILTLAKEWVDATKEDAIAAVDNPIPAKFRDDDNHGWHEGSLSGILRYDGVIGFADDNGNIYERCKVLKPKKVTTINPNDSDEKDITNE